MLFIDLPEGYEHASLQLVDISGNKLPVTEDNNRLSRILYLSTLAPGNYMLEILNNGTLSSYKVTHY